MPPNRLSPSSGRIDPTFAALSGSVSWLRETCATTLSQQLALAAIPAPTGHESRRADAVRCAFLRVGGLEVRQDNVGNVIARLPAFASDAERAPVAVLAHLDTVFDDEVLPPARFDGTRVYASGIGDNGRGLAAMLTIAEALQRDEAATLRTRPIEFVATVGEEGAGNLRGARHYFEQRAPHHPETPIAAVALDGPGDAMIVHHAIASRRVRFMIDGPGGHPWADPDAANAVHAVGRAVAAIAQFADAQRAGVTVTVTRVGGGESLTSVPAHAWFDVDLRTLDHRAMARVSQQVRQLVERAREDTSRTLRLSTEMLGDRPGGSLDVLHPLVQAAQAATRWQGVEPQSASASTDANIPLSLGIPAITIGAGGRGGGAHTPHEWYDDTDGARGVARALGIVLKAIKLPSGDLARP